MAMYNRTLSKIMKCVECYPLNDLVINKNQKRSPPSLNRRIDRGFKKIYSSMASCGRPLFKILLFAALVASSLIGTDSFAKEILLERIVAEVNGDIVSFGDVMKKIRRGNIIEVAAYPASREDTPFEIALQDLINKKLVIQKVEESGIEMTDEKVEQEVADFLAQKGSNREGLMEALRQEGMTYQQYVEDFRNSLIIKHFQGRFIIPAVKISEKDIELHYFRMLGSSPSGVKLKLRQIFVGLSEDASDEVQEAKLEILDKVMTKLNDGDDFAELAKIYSEAPSAAENGGSLPLVQVSDLAPKFLEAIEKMDVKQYSQPIQAGPGFYIFYLEEKVLSDSSDFKAQKQKVEYDLRTREMERETVNWLENQRALSKIKIIKE